MRPFDPSKSEFDFQVKQKFVKFNVQLYVRVNVNHFYFLCGCFDVNIFFSIQRVQVRCKCNIYILRIVSIKKKREEERLRKSIREHVEYDIVVCLDEFFLFVLYFVYAMNVYERVSHWMHRISQVEHNINA